MTYFSTFLTGSSKVQFLAKVASTRGDRLIGYALTHSKSPGVGVRQFSFFYGDSSLCNHENMLGKT